MSAYSFLFASKTPWKEAATNLVAAALAQESRIVIPVTSIMGTYHIARGYLRTPKLLVKKILEGILRTRFTGTVSSSRFRAG